MVECVIGLRWRNDVVDDQQVRAIHESFGHDVHGRVPRRRRGPENPVHTTSTGRCPPRSRRGCRPVRPSCGRSRRTGKSAPRNTRPGTSPPCRAPRGCPAPPLSAGSFEHLPETVVMVVGVEDAVLADHETSGPRSEEPGSAPCTPGTTRSPAGEQPSRLPKTWSSCRYG